MMFRWSVPGVAAGIALAVAAAPGCAGDGASGGADAREPGSSSDAAGGNADAQVGVDAPVPTGPADAAPQPASCSGLAEMPSDQVLELTSGGRTRRFRLHVPPGYDPTAPTPLVFNFHGLNSNAGQQALFSGLSSKADEAGFLAVHPEGVSSSWNGGGCCGSAANTGVDDVGFVADMIEELATLVCLDRRRIYATGMSNGGFMSHRLACDLADTFAAIAPVTGVNAANPCTPTRPVPVLQIHGTSDTVVSYSGAVSAVEGWIKRNGCTGAPVTTYQKGQATCEAYQQCSGGAEVIFCTLTGFGHWWPGAFGASADLDATDAVWDFFSKHALPPP